MPSRDEVLQNLVNEVAILKGKVAELEKASAADPWDEEFTIEPAAPPEGLAPARPASGDPDEDADDEMPQVREARERLKHDNEHAAIVEDMEGDAEFTITSNGVDVTIQVPSPTKQQQFMRAALANQVIANLPKVNHDDARQWYIEYGPIWLHNFDRHHAINLPQHLRQKMVEDVATTAPNAAKKLARDLLKVTDLDAQQSWARDAADLTKEEALRRMGV